MPRLFFPPFLLGLILAILFAGRLSFGQELQADSRVVTDTPPNPDQPASFPTDNPAVQVLSNDSKETGQAMSVTPTGAPSMWENLFSHGSPFFFGLTIGETYDDNIFISQAKVGDFYTHITPLIDFTQGDKTAANASYLNLFFRPTLFFYDRNSNQDRTDYDAEALFQHQWTRLTLGLEQEYQELTDASIDVGNFFKRDIHTTTATAAYAYDDHLNINGSLTQQLTFTPAQTISQTDEWIADAAANYQIAPKLTVGLGPKAGFADIIGAPNQTFEDLLARVNYAAGAKISIHAEAGGEVREFENSPSRLFPVFDASATYTPFDGTMLSASAYREDVISYSEVGDDYLSTQVQLSLRQRFLTNLFFLLSGGYSLDQYQSDGGTGLGGRRNDNYYFATVGFEWDPREWISFRLQAQTSQDKSSAAVNSFTDDQIDLQSSLQF